MASNLYNTLQGPVSRHQNSMRQDPQQMMAKLRQNPAQALKQAGFNVPDGMNNPQQIVQHLLNSGQVSNGKLAQLQQMAKMFGRR